MTHPRIRPHLALLCLWFLSWNGALAQRPNISSEFFFLDIRGNNLKIPYYANYNIYAPDPAIDKAVVVIHGVDRNADEYLASMESALEKAREEDTHTLLIAPQFLIEADIDFNSLDSKNLYWTDGGWTAGSNSRDEQTNPRPERIPSYAVLDSLLLHLAEQFPTLGSIVIVGHSAGGQVAQRMAATSPMADLLCARHGISTSFVVANPSSYVYLDGQRKRAGSTTQFALPVTSCTGYNDWKYGLGNPYTYPARLSADSIRNKYQRRIVTYLLGAADNNPSASGLDISCEARLQGQHRYERGIVFYNYLQYYYGNAITTNHTLSIVPNVGHNNFTMFNSPQGIQAIFGQTASSCNNPTSRVQWLADDELEVYPNPTSGMLTITASVPQNALLRLFDLQGRLWLSQTIAEQRSVDLHSFPKGVYLLLLQMGEKAGCEKIVLY